MNNKQRIAASALAAAFAMLGAAGAHAEAYEGVQPLTSSASRTDVKAEAVAAAHRPLQSLDRRAFYRDEVPAAYKKPSVSFTQQAGLPVTARP